MRTRSASSRDATDAPEGCKTAAHLAVADLAVAAVGMGRSRAGCGPAGKRRDGWEKGAL